MHFDVNEHHDKAYGSEKSNLKTTESPSIEKASDGPSGGVCVYPFVLEAVGYKFNYT
jgi:hypothetical protein